MTVRLVDCTLRDGGYYNDWDFDPVLVASYLTAMSALKVDFVEIGFRSFQTNGFRGPYFYSTDAFLDQIELPADVKLGVMVNAGELVTHPDGAAAAIKRQFKSARDSRVRLVRIACHIHEFDAALKASAWLKERGYLVGYNLMQIAGQKASEIEALGRTASQWPIDVLYFADSLGSMDPERTSDIISALRSGWSGELGIHTHDNMGNAVANSIRAVREGVTWVDSTVTGMGRGPGNAQTEYVSIELEAARNANPNLIALLACIRRYFKPMQNKYGWGANAFYYLAGKHGIHPTYVQEMLADARFAEEDILAAIEHLRHPGGAKYSQSALEETLNFYAGAATGSWSPAAEMKERDVLILGNGPSIAAHRTAIENFVRTRKPVVIALNAQTPIASDLIDLRAASHPLRLLADLEAHKSLPQPLITPYAMLPESIRDQLRGHDIRDFGLTTQTGRFAFAESHVEAPSSIVMAYTLSIAASGQARSIFLAGVDGYEAGDPRNAEMETLLASYVATDGVPPILAITPTKFNLPQSSVYAPL